MFRRYGKQSGNYGKAIILGLIIVFSGLLILNAMSVRLCRAQSASAQILISSEDQLYCDGSSPAILSVVFNSTIQIEPASIEIDIKIENEAGEFVDYRDSFGDKLFHTTFITENGNTVAKTSIGADDSFSGTKKLQIIIFLRNTGLTEITADTWADSVSKVDGSSFKIVGTKDLLVSDDYGGERKKTYTYDDLKSMTTGELIKFLIMVIVSNYAWPIIFIISFALYGRYRGIRRRL